MKSAPRSRIHMLRTAAARLESDHANPKLIKDLRDAAKEHESRMVDGRGWSADDEKRVESQRTLFTMLPVYTACDRLKAAMMQRAYDLLWDGNCTACDAILEFLPAADAEKTLNAWDNDQDRNNEPTEFYHSRIK